MSLNHQSVVDTMKEHREDIARCYEPANAKDPRPRGVLFIKTEVNEQGDVLEASVWPEKTTFHDTDVEKCILDSVTSWKFPPSPKGQLATVGFPIRYN